MKKPVHTCLVHGRTVHFYDAPPDKPMRMPWVDAEAFFAAAGQRRAYSCFPDFAATQAPDAHLRIPTPKGIRLTISFHLAVGLIDGIYKDQAEAKLRILTEYTFASTEAASKLYPDDFRRNDNGEFHRSDSGELLVSEAGVIRLFGREPIARVA